MNCCPYSLNLSSRRYHPDIDLKSERLTPSRQISEIGEAAKQQKAGGRRQKKKIGYISF